MAALVAEEAQAEEEVRLRRSKRWTYDALSRGSSGQSNRVWSTSTASSSTKWLASHFVASRTDCSASCCRVSNTSPGVFGCSATRSRTCTTRSQDNKCRISSVARAFCATDARTRGSGSCESAQRASKGMLGFSATWHRTRPLLACAYVLSSVAGMCTLISACWRT